MENQKKKRAYCEPIPLLTKILLICSFLSWLVFFFTGVVDYDSTGLTIGGMVMASLAFIIPVMALSQPQNFAEFINSPPIIVAIYANIFYFACLVLTCAGIKKADKSSTIFMLGTAAFIFSPELHKLVVSWGYGAIAWGLALILLTIAAWVSHVHLSHRKIMVVLMMIFSGIVFGFWKLKQFKDWQWENATIEERKLYLRPYVAFGNFKSSGELKNALPKQLPNNQLPVEITGNLYFYAKRSQSYKEEVRWWYHEMPFDLPKVLLYQGYLVDMRHPDYTTFTPSQLQAAYRYQVQGNEKTQAVQSLHDIAKNQEIWRSDVKELSPQMGGKSHNFDAEMIQLFPVPELTNSTPDMDLPKHSVFKEICPVQAIPDVLKKTIAEEDALYLDNRIFVSNKLLHYRMIGEPSLWCNERWVAFLEIDANPKEQFYQFVVTIHQRHDFKRQGDFSLINKQNNQANIDDFALLKKYGQQAHNHIHELEIKDDKLIIKHELGETVLNN